MNTSTGLIQMQSYLHICSFPNYNQGLTYIFDNRAMLGLTYVYEITFEK